jgi:hypothetical protein
MILDIPLESSVSCQLRRPRASGAPVSVPLGVRGPVVELAASRRRIPEQFAGDGRRGTADLPRYLANTAALGSENGDLLSLGE